MISLAHELFMSEHYPVTLIRTLKGVQTIAICTHSKRECEIVKDGAATHYCYMCDGFISYLIFSSSLAAILSSFFIMWEQSSIRRSTKHEEQRRQRLDNSHTSLFLFDLTDRSYTLHKYTLVTMLQSFYFSLLKCSY